MGKSPFFYFCRADEEQMVWRFDNEFVFVNKMQQTQYECPADNLLSMESAHIHHPSLLVQSRDKRIETCKTECRGFTKGKDGPNKSKTPERVFLFILNLFFYNMHWPRISNPYSFPPVHVNRAMDAMNYKLIFYLWWYILYTGAKNMFLRTFCRYLLYISQ